MHSMQKKPRLLNCQVPIKGYYKEVAEGKKTEPAPEPETVPVTAAKKPEIIGEATSQSPSAAYSGSDPWASKGYSIRL